MGILASFPPGLVTFLTWVVIWLGASLVILALSIAAGYYLTQFMDYIIKGLR